MPRRGGAGVVLELFRKVLEGSFEQYSKVITRTTDIARHGVYRREFRRHFDRLHTGEGLRAHFFQSLSDPFDARYERRLRRFAGL